MPLDEFRLANRSNWDDRVGIHVPSREYGAAEFVADSSRISGVVAFDAERLGDVRGKRLLHLQCHFGRDTLSWAALGATVTGVDFSSKGIAAARRLSEESGVPGRFVETELFEAPSVLPERFDIVYTGVGALNWISDIHRWAQVVAAFLEPGGTFYIREGHPMLWALEDERDDDHLVVGFPYFETPEPMRFDSPITYAGEGSVEHSVTYEWNHGLGEIITALLDAGLILVGLEEHRTLEWKMLPSMVEVGGGRYALPDHPERLPLMYSLTARAPT